MKKRIILASTSQRRYELAKQMGLMFEMMPSRYEEDMSVKISPNKLAMILAKGKAKDVADRVKKGIVIGIDTFIVFKNKMMGKPKSAAHAYKMLKSFSDKKIKVYSGIAIIDAETKKEQTDYVVSEVKFSKMTDKEIKTYIATKEPLDKAGAFGIQALGSIFVEKVSGCYFNIVGFPIDHIYKNLKKFGVNIFEFEAWKGK